MAEPSSHAHAGDRQAGQKNVPSTTRMKMN
jgi:hypothetical protein